jgi:uncharacterized protein YbjT (DUF2867 family)
VLGPDAVSQLAGAEAEVIIEATGLATISRKKAIRFFTGSTRAVAAAARASGARHLLLSIVNSDLPQVQGFGYFAGKSAQEKVAREQSPDLVIVRSTQWFEFAGQTLERMKAGPFAFVPAMKTKPVALDAVAKVIAECATGARPGDFHQVAGPETTTLWEMAKQLPGKRVRPVLLAPPTGYGRAFRKGALVPGDEVEVVGPRFEQWLAETKHSIL